MAQREIEQTRLTLRRRIASRPVGRRSLRLEPLEERQLLAVIWDGGGGDLFWSNPLNWTEDRLPVDGDAVVIGNLQGDDFVQFADVDVSIRELSIQRPLDVSSGFLLIEENALLDAELRVSGGLLFIQDSVVVEGTGTLLVESGGLLALSNVSLGVELQNFGSPGVGSNEEAGVLVLGIDTTFSGGFLNGPDALLSIQGDVGSSALLTIEGGFVNEGFIDLASAGFGPTTIALVVDGGPLVNRGTITTFGDHADDLHLLIFDLVNEGFVDALGDTTISGQVTTTFDSEISVIATDTVLRPVLTFDRGFTNEGVIVLFDEATGEAAGEAMPTLRVIKGSLKNAADGQIISDLGDSLGPRRIEADIENAGLLLVEQSLNVIGNIVNSGEIVSSATLNIDGSFLQSPAGRLEIDLGGVRPGVDFDLLTVRQKATLGGTLHVSLLDGFQPQVGDTFQLILSAEPSGQFASVSLPDLDPPAQFESAVIASGYRLAVIAEKAPPVVSIESGQVIEGSGGVTPLEFLVRLSEPSSAVITVDFSTGDATALAGFDYKAAQGTIKIPAGETLATIRIDVLDDLIDEFDESFSVDLSGAVGAQLDPLRSSAVGTIIDDDTAVVSIEDTSVVEGDGAAEFDLLLSTPLDRPLTISYRTKSDTATSGEDFEAIIAQIVVPAGETTAKISVAVIDDVLDESNETFLLELTDAGGALVGIDSAVGTIIDDDQAALVIDDVTVFEGHQGLTTATLTVRLTAPVDREVRVDFATNDETAVAGEDYLPTSGTLVFAPGETTASIVVSVIGDRDEETRRRTLTVDLSNPIGVELGRPRGLVNIIDDDVEVDEDAPPRVIDFSGLADLLPITGLRVTDNTNSALLSTNIDNAAKTAKLVFAPNAFGQADVTFDLLAGEQVLTSAGLSVTVAPVNDAPTAAAIDDVFAGSGISQVTIDLADIFDDIEDETATLMLTTSAESGDPLFSAVDLDSAAGKLTLIFADAAGRQTVSVTATDSQGASVSSDFVVTVDRAAPLIEHFALSAADDSRRGAPGDNTTFNPLPSLVVELSDAFPGGEDKTLSVVLDIDVGGPHERRVTTTVDVQSDVTTAMVFPLKRPLDEGPTIFNLRVIDAAGNSTADRLTVHVDRRPPVVVDRSVRTLFDDTGVPRGLEFTIFFSEELYVAGSDNSSTSVGAINDRQNLRLTGADGTEHEITSIEYRMGTGMVGGEITPPQAVITIDPPGGLPDGDYELALIGSRITDRAGNFFGGSDPRIGFQFFAAPPIVENVRALPPIGAAASRGVLVELGAADLNETEAANTANYVLERLDDAGQPTETVPLTTANYNSLADRIILWGEVGLPAGTYRLTILTEPDAAFAGSTGVTGVTGLALDGDRDGRPGGRLVATFTVEAASGSLELDRTAVEGNLQALDMELKRILQQGEQSEAALASDTFQKTLLDEIDLVLRELEGADSQTIAEAVNARIEAAFAAARDAEYLLRDFAAGEFIIVWGHDVLLSLENSAGTTLFQTPPDPPDGLSLAVVPVRLAGALFSNELLTRLDGVDARPDLTYTLELTGLADMNQAGVVYFGSAGEAAQIARSDAPAAGERHELDLSDRLDGLDPRLPEITQTVVDNVRAIVGGALDSFLILWLDPVDFVLADSQGVTSEHTGNTNVDQAPGAIHVANDFSELLIIPNAPADVYTLELVGVGGEFRGEAIFVEGNSFRSVPLQGLLGSSDRLVAQIDFRSDTPTQFFTPPIFDVAVQNAVGGGVFSVADPTGDATQATISSDASSTTSTTGIAADVRGGRTREDGGDNWIEWLFKKLRRAIDEVDEEPGEEDEKPAAKEEDEEDEEEEDRESADPLGRVNDDTQQHAQSVRSTPSEVADDEPVGENAETDASEPINRAVATDAALEEMEASTGALLAIGLVREVASKRMARSEKMFLCPK
ncbi:MAG: hypothetical protein IID44_05100 [Planctomycetes bacterium]|nr:hypothetical protein [Planctomycetota bacterium]